MNNFLFTYFSYFRILGTPDSNTWPDCKNMPHYKDTFPKWTAKKMSDVLPNLDANGIDLLAKMLAYDPNKRITAKQALLHVSYIFLILSLAIF